MAASCGRRGRKIFPALAAFVSFLVTLNVSFAEPNPKSNRTLRQAHIITRHGKRSPIEGYPKDNITEDQWPQGWGQLTERGELQHYRLGQFLKQRYMKDNQLLNEIYNRSEIWIRSSAYDRTIMSAQSCLAGLYPLPNKSLLNMTWQPIPVWTQKITTDFMMSPSNCDCPRLQQLEAARNDSANKSEFYKNSKEFLKFLREQSGLLGNSTFQTYERLADTIIMELYDGREVNTWAQNETVQSMLRVLLDKWTELIYSNITNEETRFVSGLLLKEINGSFGDIVTNSKHHQAHIFSGHDSTISPILSALGQPPYPHNPRPASCILLELYQEVNGRFTVEMHYRNSSDEVLYEYSIKGCSARPCPLEEFQKIVKDMIPDDIEKDCFHETLPPGSSPLGGFIVTMVIISCAALVVVVFVCLVTGRKGRDRLFKKQSRFEPINFQLLGNPGSDSEDADVFDSIKIQ